MTEIKYRGPLTKIQLKKLTEYLLKKGELIESDYEKVVFFDTSIFPQIGDFTMGFSRLSLKENSQKAVLRIKEGNPSEPERNEIAVSINKKHCANVTYILNRLGLKKGFYRPAHTQKFLFKNITVSIKTKCIMGDHFEIELPNKISIDDSQIFYLLKRFPLFFWSKIKYQQRINKLMKKFPAVNVFESNIWKIQE
jgi:hypothetical protein